MRKFMVKSIFFIVALAVTWVYFPYSVSDTFVFVQDVEPVLIYSLPPPFEEISESVESPMSAQAETYLPEETIELPELTETPEPTPNPPSTQTEHVPSPVQNASESIPAVAGTVSVELINIGRNSNIVGHLRVGGTTINYDVVQGEDNRFYLYHDINGNPSNAGWIFLDYEVDIRRQDQNMVIYGHNMNRNHMFHGLRNFRSYDFLRANPTITFNTLYGNYEWEIFAFYVAHISFPYTIINFPNDATFRHMIQQFKESSMHDTGVTVLPSDRILTLSTCTNVHQDERYVLQARLIN